MRAAAYQILTGSEKLQELGFTKASILRSLAADGPEQRPFMVLSWGEENVAFRGGSSENLTVWVYDEPGSYDRIDEALDEVKRLFEEAVDVEDGLGGRLATADWRGRSVDLYDDIFKCATRNALLTVVGRG